MPSVPGLRSSYAKVGRLVHFGRMIDKIRLHSAGLLPADYVPNLGDDRPTLFDARCCRFLGVRYADLRTRALAGAPDAEILAWAEASGTPRTDDDCEAWNRFMMKIGWRDNRSEMLKQRIRTLGLEGRPIETFFDLNDFDEGRDPVSARAWDPPLSTVVLIMGVAGSGKTTVGLKLAAALGWSFRDADDFHPAANVARMAAGIALDDGDRAPWLAAIRSYISGCLERGEGSVVTCSALKESYRNAAIPDPARVRIVHLSGDFGLILKRIGERQGHFMKENLLRSQFEALEPPKDALVLDIAQSPDALVAQVRRAFGLQGS